MPVTVNRKDKDRFFEKLKRQRSSEDYPRLFVHFIEMDDEIMITGIGSDVEVAKKSSEFFREHPELREKKSNLKSLRTPKVDSLIRFS